MNYDAPITLPPAYFTPSQEPRLAYHYVAAEAGQDAPTVVFLGGFRSDMNGTKALFLDQACRARGQAYLRFDYRGHGQSDGIFEEGCIGLWFQDALRIIDALTTGPLVLVGSSMGGWIGLLVARARPSRVQGFIGIAAAPDFTRDMMAALTPEQLKTVMAEGIIRIPNHYSDEPYTITKLLLQDGPQHFLLEGPLDLPMKVRLLQGMQDQDVPWQTAFRINNALAQGGHDEAEVLLIEDGDHRLSRDSDLALLDQQVRLLSGFED